MNIILIDTSYIFHRVVATKIWASKANKTFNNETIYENFISSITKLAIVSFFFISSGLK